MVRRVARVDANQPEIVKDLRRLGYRVAITSQLGSGFPDLVVGHPARANDIRLVEIKDPSQPPSQRKLTPDEQEFFQVWGRAVVVAETVQDVLTAFARDWRETEMAARMTVFAGDQPKDYADD